MRSMRTVSITLAVLLAGCAADPGAGNGTDPSVGDDAVAQAVPVTPETTARGATGATAAEVPADRPLEPALGADEVTPAVATPAPGDDQANPGIIFGPPSCKASDLPLTNWPLDGADGVNWAIENYTDMNSTAGAMKDWKNFTGAAARTYDGHNGIDIITPDFRTMDNGSSVVHAVVGGTVTYVDSSNMDRNQATLGSCAGLVANQVTISHANGFQSFYFHFKKGSITVKVGDVVTAGQVLGVAGSSGCSTNPHVHYEVHDCAGKVLDTNALGMWVAPKPYAGPSGVLDVVLKKGQFASASAVIDPAPNVKVLKPGDVLGIGLSLAVSNGDVVSFQLLDPTNAQFATWQTTQSLSKYTAYFPTWWWTMGSTPGTWTLKVSINGALKATRTVNVSNYTPGYGEIGKNGVSEGAYQGVFTDITAAGYRPVWVDGYDVGGSTYFNAIFRPEDGTPWVAFHGQTAAQYQADFDTWTKSPNFYRPLQVESYLSGGNERFAVIFVKQAGPSWTAFHNDTTAQFDAFYNANKATMRPVNVSVVAVGGVNYYTALWDTANVGGWLVKPNLTRADYQTTFNSEKAAGHYVKYVDAHLLNGTVYFSAIWDSVGYGSYSASHDMNASAYQTNYTNLVSNGGYITRFVSGYDSGGIANWVAVWTH